MQHICVRGRGGANREGFWGSVERGDVKDGEGGGTAA